MIDVLPLLAWLAILPAAVLSWRLSRVVSLALAAVWLSTLGYLVCAHAWPEAWACGRLEWQRWASAAAGLAGVWTLVARGARRVRDADDRRVAAQWAAESGLRGAEVWAEFVARGSRRYAPGRPDALAALIVGSMASDAAAHLVHRGAGVWVLPVVQLLALAAMCLVSAWPRRSVQ